MAAKPNAFLDVELTMSAGEVLEFLPHFLPADKQSIMLWGGPGIGKSAICAQLVTRLNRKGICDIRLADKDVTVIGGIPARHPEKPHLMTMLRPDFYPEEDGWILLLDEFSNCPPAVQNVALQILLDRRVGNHKLPDDTIIMACGNRQKDGAYVSRLSLPAANRMKHITVVPTWEDVRSYFKANDLVSQYIVSFLDSKPEWLYKLPEDKNTMSFPTPRSWEHFGCAVAAAMEGGNVKKSLIEMIAVATIGKAVAIDFANFLELANKIDPVDIIEKGNMPPLSANEPGLVFAACGVVITYFLTKCGTAKNNLDEKKIKNFFTFVDALPTEYQVKCTQDMNWHNNPKHMQAGIKYDKDRFMKMGRHITDTLLGRVS